MKGITFGQRNDGQTLISNAAKKALTLISCGGVYSNEASSGREYALSLSNLQFQLMGYSDVWGVLAEGMAMNKENNLNKSIRQVQAIAREWYKKDEEYDSPLRMQVVPLMVKRFILVTNNASFHVKEKQTTLVNQFHIFNCVQFLH
ncbi:MAG TPA: hypothetical protein VEH06_14355 [Candidatus Bathyarchaeia archaeon]|nr:hypothetical protein [Candidatus Bathyarchaeia archaeon]